LTNKISTIVNRDEEKDIFDLFCIAYNEVFNWGEVFKIANKKAVIDKDIFLYRLKSFPLSWLNRIKMIQQIEITPDDINTLCEDVLGDRDNSLSVRDEYA